MPVAAPLVKYATERIAHTSRQPMKERFPFGEIDRAIDVIGPMYAKYARLLNGHATTLERSTQADLVRLLLMPGFVPERETRYLKGTVSARA